MDAKPSQNILLHLQIMSLTLFCSGEETTGHASSGQRSAGEDDEREAGVGRLGEAGP